MKRLTFISACLLLVCQQSLGWESSILHKDGDGRLVYHSDVDGSRITDFSHAGYHSGDVSIPTLPVVHTISPVAGDNTAHIQAAINTVAAMTPDANGHRGAVLLTKGTYNVSGIVYVNASGIVLRGEGQGSTANDTVIIGTGTQQMKELGVILVKSATGGSPIEGGTTQNVVSEFIPVGSRTFEVENGSLYSVGDYLVIQHDPTAQWLSAINYGNVDGDEVPWVPGQNDLKMYFHGTVTAIDGNKIKFDTPIYHELDRSLSQAVVYRHTGAGIITECGIEKLRVISQNAGGTDESHRWDCVHFIGARNCWAQDSTSVGFAESGFRFSNSTRSTVLDCSALDPVSKIEGGRRYNFYIGSDCHDILFKGCYSRKGRHSFVSNGTATSGGIVFTQGTSHQAYSSSESHRRWGEAILWDDIAWTSASASMVLGLYNRGASGTSHGWTGTGFVAWNISAPGKYIMCSEPPLGQHYAIGCNANITRGNYPYGHVEGTGNTLSMPSLYEAQLAERHTYGVGPDAPARLRASHYSNTGTPFAVLHWADIALDETAYAVERSDNGGSSYAVVAELPADTEHFTDTSLALDGSYIYRLQAVNAIGSSAYGNAVAVDLSADEQPASVTYQAEDFISQSGASVRWDRHAFTGFGYVDMGGASTWIELEIDGGMGGPVPITFRHGAGGTDPRPCAIIVNGIEVASGTFTSTGSWDVWGTETITVPLQRGMNTLRIQPNGGAYGPNLDKIEVPATPIIYAAGEASADTAATKAFDGDVNTVWKHHSPYGSWIQYAYGGAIEITEYQITSSTSLSNDPKDWKFMGSNDGGVTWTTLDTQSGVLFTAWKQTRAFTIASPGSYQLYRLEVTALRSSAADFVQLSELQLIYTSLPPLTPDPAAFAVDPHPVSETAIAMTAVTGSSIIGTVEYYFDEISGNPGGSDSGWTTSPTYTDTGLTSGTQYIYSVTMRDLPGNETAPSADLSASPYQMTTIVWNGGSGSDGRWTTDANWTGGVSPMLAEQYKKVVFNVPAALECELDTAAAVAQLVVGDNGTTGGNYLRLTDGAHLTAGARPGANPVWTAIGYNRPATVTVEFGAVFETADYILIGFSESGASHLDIIGGTVDISTAINLGNTANTSFGIISIDGGGRLTGGSLSIKNTSSGIDLRNGTMILNGDHVGTINSYISSGNIAAYGALGVSGVDFDVDYNNINPGKTTVRALRTVPNVTGLTQSAAETAIISVNLSVGDIATSSSATIPAGQVISQDPAAASSAYGGSPVDLVVSLGPLVTQTTTAWRGAESGDWTVNANWTSNAAPMQKVQNLKVVFNGGTAQECTLGTASLVAQLVIGDNGPQTDNRLRLAAGADLTCGLKPDNTTAWTGIGYNRPAMITVESGARLTAVNHLWIGHFSPSVASLIVDGGTVEVQGTLGLGWNDGAGTLNIRNGGLLTASDFSAAQSISSNSTINIDSGALELNGNHVATVNAYIAAGRMTAYHGASSLNVSHDAGTDKTTVTAIPYGFDAWALDWEVDLGGSNGDYDNDMSNNFYEYALNGDPTDELNTGVNPVLIKIGGQLVYIHLQRNDDPNLVYTVEACTNLFSGAWEPAGSSVIGTGIMGGGAFYDAVTNSIPTADGEKFIRLKVIQP